MAARHLMENRSRATSVRRAEPRPLRVGVWSTVDEVCQMSPAQLLERTSLLHGEFELSGDPRMWAGYGDADPALQADLKVEYDRWTINAVVERKRRQGVAI
jgi:hypothetical protein